MADNDEAINVLLAGQNYDRAAAEIAERQRISAALADRALQALLLTNGGALVALFSFVASASKVSIDLGMVKWAFAWFAIGLFLGLAAHVAAFMSQHRFTHQAYEEMWRAQAGIRTRTLIELGKEEAADYHSGTRHYFTGIGLTIASIVFFVIGCGAALLAVRG
ncbi:hypothetical protein [Rhizorhabdus sp.]|uniref:hypothetical protein n=1 Tax=Rhizorhabdus sp. TaxID=1968843 RepID=UPI0035B1E2E1